MRIIFKTSKFIITTTGIRITEADNKGCFVQGLTENGWINIILFNDMQEGSRFLEKIGEECERNPKRIIYKKI